MLIYIISTNEKKESHRSIKTRKNLLNRLNRIEGQIRGLKRLIESDAHCDDVLIQIAAAHSALNNVGKLIIAEHIRGYAMERIKSGDDNVMNELLVTLSKI
ncbi:metal-sensing transcriptional repressor [Paenibacillus silviterrae]|uniref:metal-sensing transcriptional repressor n=1 Tax=Paenibacillus silviterrae TaxID=3242194 RepID=UPI002543AAB1|nr:metal-sensing transcriptional repressor [Paenibacillus chinjuensis]